MAGAKLLTKCRLLLLPLQALLYKRWRYQTRVLRVALHYSCWYPDSTANLSESVWQFGVTKKGSLARSNSTKVVANWLCW